MLLLTSGASTASPLFKNNSVLRSDTGYITLEWENTKGEAVELQQSENQNFKPTRTIYSGQNKSFFLSGLQDGAYYYRIRAAADKSWSSPITTLHVVHHSMKKALSLFALGAFIFIAIVFVVLRGASNEQ